MAKPYGKLVKHRFHKTTVVSGHVFFKGEVEVPERILALHKQQEIDAARKQALAEGREGMTATELMEAERREVPESELRQDGPTPEAWVRSGYIMENYPPPGYAPKPSESESKEKKK